MARLQDYYRSKVVPQLKEDLGLDNAMQVPRVSKITLNMGVGAALVLSILSLVTRPVTVR